MPLTTGTFSNYASEFHWPSGTNLVYCQVTNYPEIVQMERNITNHTNGGWEERVPAGLSAAGDFTLVLLATPGVRASLETDRAAKTQRTAMLTDDEGNLTFVGWIKSIQKESADAQSPDSVKLTVVITPVGQVA